MKRVILLSIILGLTLTLTGCKPNDAESNIQQSETSVATSETNSTVRTESATSSIPKTASKEDGTIVIQSEPIVTDALDTPTNSVTSITEVDTPTTTSVANSDEIILSDTASPQLEPVSENVPIEEDTGDFGELFS